MRMENYNKIKIIFAFIISLFSLLQFTNIAEAATTTTKASFDTTQVNGNFYQATINFQLSDEGTQLILYSPDYDNLEVDMLKSELGADNVITDSTNKQIIVNLKNKLDKNNTGSFVIDMKKASSDIIYIRDINNNDLANRDLVTGKSVDQGTDDSSKQSISALSATNLLSTNNALTVNNTLGTSGISATSAAVSVPVISVDAATVSDFDNDFTVHGTWESSQTSITIYYRFNSSAVGSTSTSDGISGWGVLGTFTGTAGVTHDFTATIPVATIRGLSSGTNTLYTNYLKPVVGNLGTPYSAKIAVSPYASDLEIYRDGIANDTTYEDPYIARGDTLTLTGKITTNVAGTLKFIVDGDTSNAPSLNLLIPGVGASVAQKINLSTLGKNDGEVHEATYEYVKGDQVLASVKYYFIVGNELKLTVPQTIDFGSHLYTDFEKGFTATPTITGDLTLFDGRTGTYSGNLGLSASATTFKNSAGDSLDANLYWDKSLIPSSGTGVQIGEVSPPTSTNPAFQNFTKDVQNNLKLVAPNNTNPQSGTYTSTVTWTVNDTLQ